MLNRFNKKHIYTTIFIGIFIFVIFPADAQTLLTDSENLRIELEQRELNDFTEAYHERVKIFDAWNEIRDEIATNNLTLSRISIGIMDTGADLSNGRHPEFVGVDFSGSDPSSLTDDASSEGHEQGHGTQVAGIIGANNLSASSDSNYQFPQMNGIISGVFDRYNLVLAPKSVRINPLSRILGFLPFFTTGFEKSLQIMPEDSVVNMSIGFSRCSEVDNSKGCLSDNRFEQVKRFYEEGIDARSDLLLIVSAGNDDIDAKHHLPGGAIDADNIITVAAVHLGDGRISFSNHTSVGISAPGGFIYAPTIRGKGNADLGGIEEQINYTTNFGGTSGAAPFVTGVAGLLKAISPELTPLEIKQILIETADPIDTRTFLEIIDNEPGKLLGTGCYDPNNNPEGFTGCRLNAERAVNRVLPLETTSASPGSAIQGETLNITITGKHFSEGVMSADFGEGITVNSINVISSEELTANITIQPSANTGTRDITIIKQDPAGSSATLEGAFTVVQKEPCVLTGLLSEDATITKAQSPCVIGSPGQPGGVTVAGDTTLTIESGVVIKFFAESTQIVVAGTLDASGTSSEPVFFTSIKDDTVGGDTNNDGSLTSPSRADWRRILILKDGKANLNHSVIRYGGRSFPLSDPGRGNIVVFGSLNTQNTRINHAAFQAVEMYEGSTANIASSEIDNSSNGIVQRGGSAFISFSSIHDNDGRGVHNTTTEPTDARNNWWGHPTGPFHSDLNPDGEGDTISDNVLFEPFLAEDPL